MSERRPAMLWRPGTILLEELDARGWTVNDLANQIPAYRESVYAVITGSQGVSDDLAVALSTALGTSAGFWRNLERRYRAWVEEQGND